MEQIIENRKKAGGQKILPSDEYTGLLVTAPYPQENATRVNKEITERFETLKELIRTLRGLRVECGIDPASKLHIAVKISKGSSAEVIKEKTDMVCLLAGISKVDFVESNPEKSIGAVGKGFEAFLLVDESVNKEQLRQKFTRDIEYETENVRRSTNKLNGKFAEHAPVEVVQEERNRMEEAQRRIEKLNLYLKNL